MKYGVPYYDNEGRLTGVAFDHDGDGTYDDYEAVVSDPIASGNGYTVIGSDHDGDGIYDDTTFVVSSNGNTRERASSSDRQTYYHNNTKSSMKASGQSFFTTKENVKGFFFAILALSIFSLIVRFMFWVIPFVYRIFA